eukprot:TRINITY_DN14801_c0_g1_i1.p1 TRINITY_DN14801_c0_g1~~TRINITY_DN14801_c0_g1_i1.p1  ORF type:complete len:203 (-),score=10.12 TRINITY_DN14801_c0_g1_i1:30-638(-)
MSRNKRKGAHTTDTSTAKLIKNDEEEGGTVCAFQGGFLQPACEIRIHDNHPKSIARGKIYCCAEHGALDGAKDRIPSHDPHHKFVIPRDFPASNNPMKGKFAGLMENMPICMICTDPDQSNVNTQPFCDLPCFTEFLKLMRETKKCPKCACDMQLVPSTTSYVHNASKEWSYKNRHSLSYQLLRKAIQLFRDGTLSCPSCKQ